MMPLRDSAGALIVIAALLFAAMLTVAHADETPSTEASETSHGNSFGEAIKRDTRAVGATLKEGAHRVAVASKAVAHEVATAAKRGAAETRAAFRGEKVNTPAS
jgi:hypothetical protein